MLLSLLTATPSNSFVIVGQTDLDVSYPNFHTTSAPYFVFNRHEWNLEELLETIWDYTKMIRIYTKVITVACVFYMHYALHVCLFVWTCLSP